jgi:hypothetical protein
MSSEPTNSAPPKEGTLEEKPAATEEKPTTTEHTPEVSGDRKASVAEVGQWHKTHHDFQEHGHNPSRQEGVTENNDLALRYSHEHQHQHLHHGRTSISGRHDDILYAKGTTLDKHVPTQDFSHHPHSVDAKDQLYGGSSDSTDAEKGGLHATRVSTTGTNDGENAGRKYRFSTFYAKYKIFFHLFIWLLFTG